MAPFGSLGWPTSFLPLIFFGSTANALAFGEIGGPFVRGEPVSVSWSLDGTEGDWELWYKSGGSSSKLANVAMGDTSIVVVFPGLDGAFQGLKGITMLATSAQVNAAVAGSLSSPSPPSTVRITTTQTSPQPAITSESSSNNTVNTRPNTAVAALLGVVVAILAVVAVIVFASVFLCIQRRRRRAATAAFIQRDVERQAGARPPPSLAGSIPRVAPPRNSSLSFVLPRGRRWLGLPKSPSPDLGWGDQTRRAAFRSADIVSESESDIQEEERSYMDEKASRSVSPDLDGFPIPPPVTFLPEPASRRAMYLTESLIRLEFAKNFPQLQYQSNKG